MVVSDKIVYTKKNSRIPRNVLKKHLEENYGTMTSFSIAAEQDWIKCKFKSGDVATALLKRGVIVVKTIPFKFVSHSDQWDSHSGASNSQESNSKHQQKSYPRVSTPPGSTRQLQNEIKQEPDDDHEFEDEQLFGAQDPKYDEFIADINQSNMPKKKKDVTSTKMSEKRGAPRVHERNPAVQGQDRRSSRQPIPQTAPHQNSETRTKIRVKKPEKSTLKYGDIETSLKKKFGAMPKHQDTKNKSNLVFEFKNSTAAQKAVLAKTHNVKGTKIAISFAEGPSVIQKGPSPKSTRENSSRQNSHSRKEKDETNKLKQKRTEQPYVYMKYRIDLKQIDRFDVMRVLEDEYGKCDRIFIERDVMTFSFLDLDSGEKAMRSRMFHVGDQGKAVQLDPVDECSHSESRPKNERQQKNVAKFNSGAIPEMPKDQVLIENLRNNANVWKSKYDELQREKDAIQLTNKNRLKELGSNLRTALNEAKTWEKHFCSATTQINDLEKKLADRETKVGKLMAVVTELRAEKDKMKNQESKLSQTSKQMQHNFLQLQKNNSYYKKQLKDSDQKLKDSKLQTEKLSNIIGERLEKNHTQKRADDDNYASRSIDMNGFIKPDEIEAEFENLMRSERLNFLSSLEDDILNDDEVPESFNTFSCDLFCCCYGSAKIWLGKIKEEASKELHGESKEPNDGETIDYLQKNFDELFKKSAFDIQLGREQVLREKLMELVSGKDGDMVPQTLGLFQEFRKKCLKFCCQIVLSTPPYWICSSEFDTELHERHPDSEKGKYVDFYVWPTLRTYRRIARKGIVFCKDVTVENEKEVVENKNEIVENSIESLTKDE